MLSRTVLRATRPKSRFAPTIPSRYYTDRGSPKTPGKPNGRQRTARTQKETSEYSAAYDWSNRSSFVQQKPGTSTLQSQAPTSNASKKYKNTATQQNEANSAAASDRATEPLSGVGNPSLHNGVTSDHQPAADRSAEQTVSSEPEPGSAGVYAQDGDDPMKSLPDLRHGIPSTFAKEFVDKASSENHEQAEYDRLRSTHDLDDSSTSPGGGSRGSSELPRSAYETSTDRRRNRTANWSAGACVLFGILGAVYYGRNWDTEEEERAHPEAPSGWDMGMFWKRIQARWSNQMSYYTEPTFPKLLPTMDPAPPYTLVLSLEDLLIHSEWTREHGWRTAKRPGLDYFLRYLCQYYEIVIFTTLPSTAAEPIIKKLDPLRLTIMWPLFREATRYENGEYVKDLSYLNRDLSKTVLVDTKKSHTKLQPQNSIVLPPWEGKAQDKGLVSLIPFLEYVAAMGIPDVRQAIKSFEGTDIPTEFARREAVQREAFNKQLAEEQASKPKRSASTWLTGALGMKPQSGLQMEDGQSVAEGLAQGKMLSDQARERGQKQYELMEKEIRENSEKWLKEMEAEETKMQEEFMKGMKSKVTFGSIFGVGQSSPEDKQ